MDKVEKYRKIASIALPIALVACIAMAIWAYNEKKNKESLVTRVENHYQESFNNLNHHIDILEDEMGKTLAINSQKQLSNSLENVWRLAYAAQSDLNQLPVSINLVDDLAAFTTKVANFAYHAAVRDLEKKPLSKKEYAHLKTLYTQAGSVQDDLQKIQSKVFDRHLTWLDSEAAASSNKANFIIDGFKGLDNKVKSYAKTDYDQVDNGEGEKKERVARLKGREVSPSEAKKIAAQFLQTKPSSNMTVTSNNGDYKTYTVRTSINNTEMNVEITKVGGHVIDMTSNRSVSKKVLTPDQAKNRALSFLNRINRKQMVPISYSETGNMIIFAFVHEENGIRVYPEMVSVKVALDNGEILGFDGDEYVFNQIIVPKERPRITKDYALKQVSSELTLQAEPRLAIIYNDADEKVLCYEILGFLYKESDQYRIFVNATTGKETFVEKVK